MTSLTDFIQGLPKIELHLHIEGTLEPELLFELAKRNRVHLKYESVEELKQAYRFSNLQEFLDLYYAGAMVLIEEQDFYELTWTYLQKCKAQNVVHTEIFFDPQTHTERGIPFDTVIRGINRALDDGRQKLGISSRLIICFLRHMDEASAFKTLEESLPYKNSIVGVGLDSSEKGNPPSKFERAFAKARDEGFLTFAHAGEEGPASYVKEAVDLLHISRIDHGIASIHDESLVAELAQKQIPLTVCPLSNLSLGAVENLQNHPLKTLMDKGVLVTINSDDPAYFGGYMNENYQASALALNLTKADLCQLARNAVKACLLPEKEKEQLDQAIKQYCREND